MDANPKRPAYVYGFASDPGRKRKDDPNQDSVSVVVAKEGEPWHPPLLLVADGMGGHYGGSLASQIVVRVFKEEFKRAQHPANDYAALLKQCAAAAHQEVRLHGEKDAKYAAMGSTVVAVTWIAGALFELNVGDSRAYLLRHKSIQQISQDQSWVAEKVRAGIITKQEARTSSDRNQLTMAITAKRKEIKMYTAEAQLASQDIILLCSDGLWGVVPESLILAAATELSPQAAVDKLVALANNSRGPDNISVVIARPADFATRSSMRKAEDTMA